MELNLILAQCVSQGVSLSVEQGNLGVHFEKAPTAELIGLLKQHKAELLAHIESQQQQGKTLSISKRPTDESVLPMSLAQQRIWSIAQLHDSHHQYNMTQAFTIEGSFDSAKAEQVLAAIVARHEVLRTQYQVIDEQPVQVIAQDTEFTLKLVDVSTLNEAEQAVAIEQQISTEAATPFDLAADLMLRARFIRQTDDCGVLVLTMHHIASDGWSTGLMVKAFLDGYRDGANSELAPLQYADYAWSQQQWIADGGLESQLDYWRRQLEDLPQVHQLPLDKPRAKLQQYAGDTIRLPINAELTAALRQLASEHNVTVFMLVHGLFSLMLSRFANDPLVSLGTPLANRHAAGAQDMLGFLVNTLVLKTDLTGNPSFSDYLTQVREVNLAAQANQDVPFDLLVETLNPARSASHMPLCQIVISQDSTEKHISTIEGLKFTPRAVSHQSAKFDLELKLIDKGDTLEWAFEYATTLFDATTIERMAAAMEKLAQGVVAAPQTAVFELAMVSELETTSITEQWNNTQADFAGSELMLHELFIKQVVATPDNIAVIDEQGQISYIELFAAAKQLADSLTVEKAGDLVGVLLPRGRDQVVATLAIMMAGGAYLPLDVDWPQSRCEQILAQGQVSKVITDAEHQSLVASFESVLVEGAEVDDRVAVLSACEQFSSTQVNTDLAYVIFTSGSTGQPKGVAIEHRSAVNTLLDVNHRFQVTSEDKVLAVSALSFDLSVYDYFGLLAVGGQVVIPEHIGAKNPYHWMQMVEQHGITIWDTVPVSAELLVEQYEADGVQGQDSLRVVMMSGDWINPKLPKRLWQVFANVKTHSLGGATEGSIWSITYPIEQDTSALASVPYGRPMANQQFFLLNEADQLVPVGVNGQLHIGGVGVAREYFGDAERTAKSYFDHPQFGRLYRTGDLGRYRDDGVILFAGRVDHQVKIRGHRIELGEIEAVLSAHVQLKDVLVHVVTDELGDKRLVAYYTADAVALYELNQEGLRQYVAEQLPNYMVPQHFVHLDTMPLNANGKIDIKALPKPEMVELSEYRAPSTETEQLLVNLWSELLNVDSAVIGVDNNFFELGGQSILVTKMLTRIRQIWGFEIEPFKLFEIQTLGEQATFIDQTKAEMAVMQDDSKAQADDDVEMVL